MRALGVWWWILASVCAMGCEQGAVLGAVCTRAAECQSPLACRLGRCRTECSENRDCPIGAQCFLEREGEGACQLAQDRSCGGGCPTGLDCLGDACVRACSAPNDCPRDGVCATASGTATGICVDPRSTPDAGLDGGSALDGARDDAGGDPQDAGSEGGGGDAGTPGAQLATICVGDSYACEIREADGAVFCQGDAGQELETRLGDGTFDGTRVVEPTHARCAYPPGFDTPCSTTPVQVMAQARSAPTAPLVGVRSLACGSGSACALRGREVWCWGANYDGQRADASTSTPYATATRVVGDALFAGRNHFCALDGATLHCWGQNDHAQTWLDASTGGEPPHAVATDVRRAALGAYVTCVEHTSGAVECAGWNLEGQLGRPGADGDMTAAPSALAVDASRGLVVGIRHVCALDAEGVTRCWGQGDRGALGRVLPMADPVPTPIDSASRYDALFASGLADQVCGRRADGVVECWGDDQLGTVGTPLALGTVVAPPREIDALRDATEIAFGEGSALARVPGALLGWGSNSTGQLARGTFDRDPHPESVPIALPSP